MNPNDIFFLARYAHRVLTPLMASLDGYMKVTLDFTGKFPGVDVWVHHKDSSKSGVIDYQLSMTHLKAVDDFAAKLFAAKLQVKASVAA